MRRKELLAYAAGIIDGEGCIQISRRRTKGERLKWRFALQIEVASTTPELLVFMHTNFGGAMWAEKEREDRQQAWRWKITCRQALGFLKEIQPFLVVKIRQCSLAIEFGENQRSWGGGKKPVAIYLKDENSYWEMKKSKNPRHKGGMNAT